MKFSALKISGVRCFKDKFQLELSSNINVFIGANNSGKSTILNIINCLRTGIYPQVTIGERLSYVKYTIQDPILLSLSDEKGQYPPILTKYISLENSSTKKHSPSVTIAAEDTSIRKLVRQERPIFEINNIKYYLNIINYLSRKKSSELSDNTNILVSSNSFQNLINKVDEISNHPDDEVRDRYKEICIDTIGFVIRNYTSYDANANKKNSIGLYINSEQQIPLNEMGEGVTQILGLILNLILAKDKIFIIEELENDLHPSALKKLLTLIIESAQYNQFFISTHSHIVMTMLGSESTAKIFKTNNLKRSPDIPKMTISEVFEISTSEERRLALEDLGYDFIDYGLWSGWLILEEASAQTIIQYLIKWFFVKIANKIKIVSAGGVDKVKQRFNTMKEMFLFLHLEEMYKNRSWIMIDSGPKEDKLIQDIKETYTKSGWNESSFIQLSEHDFESYYPDRFDTERKSALAIIDDSKKRAAKRELLFKVKEWIDANEDRAKAEFEKSASEVIEKLKAIETKLLKQNK